MVGLAALLALIAGFRHPLLDPWEGGMDVCGIGFSLVGFLISTLPASKPAGFPEVQPTGTHLRQTAGASLLASGLLIILGQLPLAVLFVGLAVTLGIGATRQGSYPFRILGKPASFRAAFHQHGPAICRFLLLILLLETWETASVRDRAPARMAEIGFFALLAALAALGWAAGSRGGSIHKETPGERRNGAAPRLWGALGLLLLFGGLALALTIPPFRELDAAVGQSLYHSGARSFTRLMRKISDSGGRDLMIYWLPLCLLLTRIVRGPRGVTFLAASMFGTIGLELLFKGLLGRMRPEYTHGSHFDSFPSGHTLAATILAGSLLVVYLPICRYGWQRALLWAAGLGWPMLMGFTRVYLGRHYFTDVLGGLVLGTAWVLFAAGTFRLFAREMENEAATDEQSSPNLVAPAISQASG